MHGGMFLLLRETERKRESEEPKEEEEGKGDGLKLEGVRINKAPQRWSPQDLIRSVIKLCCL